MTYVKEIRQVSAPVETPDPGRAFDAQELLQSILSYKWVVLGVAALIATTVIFWTVRQPKVYEASSQIEYDPSPPRPLGREVEEVVHPIANYWMSREFFETQNRIISSRVVAEKVVRRLGLHHDAGFLEVPPDEREKWRGTSVERAALKLQNRIVVEPVPDTRLVHIKVRDEKPERSSALANAIADAYVEKTMEDRLASTVSALEWLSTQLDTLRSELDQADLNLHKFKQEHDVLSLSLEDRQNIVANDIEQFSQSLTEVRKRRIELRARLDQLRAAMTGDPMEVHATVVSQSVAVGELRDRYRQKITARDALATRYGAEHPQMKAIARELETIQKALKREVNGLISSAEADLAEVRQVESGLRTALRDANQAGLALNLKEIEYGRLNRERDSSAKLYNLVLQRTAETDLTRMLKVTHVRIVDRALKPTVPVSPRLKINIAIGVLAGLFMGLLVAFLLGRMDRRVRSVEDAEGLGLSILGVVPQIAEEGSRVARVPYGRKPRVVAPVTPGGRDMVVHAHPMSAAAESIRAIRTNLTFASPDNPFRSLVVTSASPREGKTTIAVNLAIAVAQGGKRVLLVDTDLRRPRTHRVFSLSAARGVTSVLVGEHTLAEATQHTEIQNLDVLPCGPIPPNPAELLHSTRFSDVMNEALKRYDRVIFDSPPLGAVTDAAVLAGQTAAVLVIIRSDQTTRDAVRSAVRQLRDVGAHMRGVLNAVDVSSRRGAYANYYRYYHQYYGSDSEEDSGDETRASA